MLRVYFASQPIENYRAPAQPAYLDCLNTTSLASHTKMATLVFMPFHWGIGFKSDFRPRQVLRNRVRWNELTENV